MEELKKLEEVDKAKADREQAIKARRQRLGQERTMTFGKVTDISKIKAARKNPKPVNNLNWNPYIKKAVRGGSVEFASPAKNRSAPFKPLLARAVSIKKPQPVQMAPVNSIQARQLAKAKQQKDALAARKAIYESMFKKTEEEYGSEYDSEY